MKKLTLFVIVLAMLVTPLTAFAGDPSPWTEEDTYLLKTEGKLAYGVKNVLGGWTEIITQPMDYHKEDKSVIAGIGKGLCNAVVYTVGGAIHLVTFPVPVDVPIKDGGVDL